MQSSFKAKHSPHPPALIKKKICHFLSLLQFSCSQNGIESFSRCGHSPSQSPTRYSRLRRSRSAASKIRVVIGILACATIPDVVVAAAASRRHARSRSRSGSLHRRFKFRRRLLREQARASTQSRRRRFLGRPPSRRRRNAGSDCETRRLRKSRTSDCRNVHVSG